MNVSNDDKNKKITLIHFVHISTGDDLPEALEKELEEERQNEKIIERGKENKKEQMKILETNFTDSPHSTASTSDDIRNVSTKEQKKSPLTDDLQMIVDEDEYEEFFNNEQDFKQVCHIYLEYLIDYF